MTKGLAAPFYKDQLKDCEITGIKKIIKTVNKKILNLTRI